MPKLISQTPALFRIWRFLFPQNHFLCRPRKPSFFLFPPKRSASLKLPVFLVNLVAIPAGNSLKPFLLKTTLFLSNRAPRMHIQFSGSNLRAVLETVHIRLNHHQPQQPVRKQFPPIRHLFFHSRKLTPTRQVFQLKHPFGRLFLI